MKAITTTAAVLAALALAGCNAAAPTDDDTIKIGFVGSLSGFAADWGVDAHRGVELAVAELQASGAAVELVSEDDASDTVQTVNGYSKLVDFDNVDGLVTGTWWAFSVVPQASQAGVPLLSAETMEDGSGTYPGYFIMGGYLKNWATAYEPLLTELAPKKVAVLRYSSKFGGVLADAITEMGTRNGWTTDVYTYNDISLATEIDSLVTKLQQTKPDVVYMDGQPEGYTTALRKLIASGVAADTVILGHSAMEPVLTSGDVDVSTAKGVYFTNRMPFPAGFAAAYQAAYNEAPQRSADLAYYATFILYDALKQGGNAVETVKNTTFEKDGVQLSFDDMNVATGGNAQLVFHMEDGKAVPYVSAQ